MLTIYTVDRGALSRIEAPAETGLPPQPVWLDLLNPTTAERAAIEQQLQLEMPTHEAMQEIEVSSRLYQDDGIAYMTATILNRSDTDQPQATAVTFILTAACLVTVRYTEPRPFTRFAVRAQRRDHGIDSAEAALLGLLEAIIDRLADILEHIALQIDQTSRDVFADPAAHTIPGRDFQLILRQIGRQGDLTSKSRESLASLERLITFLLALRGHKINKARRAQLKTLSRDIRSLNDQVAFLSGKIAFLLDATLGLINIEQNGTIKIFSVMAVLFLPPTMIASIYGMNFAHMPELSWPFGYPIALLLMLLSAAIPYWYFKRRRWL